MRKLSRVSNGSPSPAAYAMRDDNGRSVRPDSFPAGIRPGQGDHPMTEFPTASPTQPLTDGHLTAEQPLAEQPAAPVTPATGDDHAVAPYTPYTPYAPTEAPAPRPTFLSPPARLRCNNRWRVSAPLSSRPSSRSPASAGAVRPSAPAIFSPPTAISSPTTTSFRDSAASASPSPMEPTTRRPSSARTRRMTWR